MSERIDHNTMNLLKRLSLQVNTLTTSINARLSLIKNSLDYSEEFVYEGTTGTDNIISVVYSGTVAGEVLVVLKTISYVDETINGSNVTKIQYS
jgi:hypothetical protein